MKILSFPLLLTIFLTTSPSRAEDVIKIVIEKQEQKKSRGWNLSEWLETRDRIRLMDLWLALHSPSPYEFFIAGDYAFGDGPNVGDYSGMRGSVAAYASLLGLEAQYDSEFKSIHGLFHFRFFGLHEQGTNLVFQTGLRSNTENDITYRNALIGLRMTFYLTRFFGLHALYRKYFDSPPNDTGQTIFGNRYEAGAFFDFSFTRLSFFYHSVHDDRSPALSNDKSRKGYHVGLQVFF